MKNHSDTEKVISGMLEVPFVQGFDARQRHLYQESLRSLVRLAKSEQIMAIKMNVKKLVGTSVGTCYMERARKAALQNAVQHQFEFK